MVSLVFFLEKSLKSIDECGLDDLGFKFSQKRVYSKVYELTSTNDEKEAQIQFKPNFINCDFPKREFLEEETHEGFQAALNYLVKTYDISGFQNSLFLKIGSNKNDEGCDYIINLEEKA